MDIIKRTFLVVLSMGLLASCSNPKTPVVTNEYLVNFNTDGGSFISAQRVEENGTIDPPSNPTRPYFNFSYWLCNGEIYDDFTKPVTSDLTLKAVWTGEQPSPVDDYCLVSFDSDGGTYIPAQVVSLNGYATEPEDPPVKKEGEFPYTFDGWFYKNEQEPFKFTERMITENITLTAHWSGTPPLPTVYHVVNFDTDGGSYVASQRIEHGSKLGLPIVTGKPDYTFGGWYKGTEYFDIEKRTITEDLVLKAKWTGGPKVYHTVTFESNGGTHIEPVPVENNTPVSEPTTPTKPDGSTFDGWYDNASFSGDPYVFSKGVTSSFTLYAKWKNPTVKHTITFVMNGATSPTAIDPIKVNDGETAESQKPDNPTKNGYGFKGWFKDEALTDSFSFTETIQKDYILYAKWGDIKTYTASFYDGGTKIVEYDQTVKYGERVQRPENPTKDKVTFSGWYKDQNLQTLYDFNAEITDLTSSTISIYAKWDNAIFAVNFASNGGTTVQPQNVPNGSPIATSPSTTYAGHTFGGWFTDDVTFENEFKFGTLAEGATPVTSSMVLYAKWTLNKIEVTIDYNHDSLTSKIDVDYGTIVPTLDIPTREGYSFTGWYDAAEGGAVWDFGTKITESGKTIYAHWIKNNPEICTIFYYPVGGTIFEGQQCYGQVPKGTEFGTLTSFPDAYRADGAMLDCWSLHPTTKVTTGTINTDAIAYAFWKDDSFEKLFLGPDLHTQAYLGKFMNNRLVNPDKAVNDLKKVEVKENYTFKGFAYTQGGAVKYTYENFYQTLPDDFPTSGSLYPIFEINTYSLTYTEHGVTPYDPTPSHDPTGTYYIINYPHTFTCDTKIVIEITLEPGPYGYTAYYIPEVYKDKCFQIKCDGNMTEPQIELSELVQTGRYKKAKITIDKAEGNITLDSWLYLNPNV